MRRYVGIAAGTALIAAVLSVIGALPAVAQGAIKPLMALIVNDESNPVPVRVTNSTASPELKRYGPLNVFAPGDWFSVLVPTVPAGSTFITTYITAIAFSNIGGALTEAKCELFIAPRVAATRKPELSS